MPYADPEKNRAYFAARYQAKKPELEAQKKARRALIGEAEQRRRRLAYNRKHKYGLTTEAFDALLAKQGGTCAICPQVFDHEAKTGPAVICVDHNHDTNQVRGLLCRGCNVAVGFMEKDTSRAIRAVDYLLAHEPLDTDQPAG